MAIETILVAVGSTDEDRPMALADAVIELAEPTGAAVVLAHVFDNDEFHALRGALADSDDDVIAVAGGRLDSQSVPEREADLSPDEVADRIVTIRDVAARLEQAGVTYTVRGGVGGDRAEAILDLATDLEADRIVVGGRRRTPAGKAIFGSTAQSVLLNAPCPVEFVRSE